MLSSRPQWPAAATFPPRVFAPLSFSFSFLKFYSKSFLLLATLKSTPLLFFLSFFFCIENSIFNVIAHRFYSSKFNSLVCLDKISANLMFRLPIRIDYCSWIVIISLLLYTLLRSIFLLQAIYIHIYLYLIIDLKRLRLS